MINTGKGFLMSKFDAVKNTDTIGTNYGIATHDLVQTLERWDASYGLEILDVGRQRLCVGFRSLPDDLTRLAEEVYGICPDVMAEHSACVAETVAVMTEEGLGDLTQGVDFEEELGLELLEQKLRSHKAVAMVWH